MALKFGMVGGGIGSYIGDLHYIGATIDDMAELVCGAFSRKADVNRATAEKRHIKDESRIYADYKEMAEKESAREDCIDFVAIMTPNNTHYEICKCFLEHNIPIMCDKPLAISIEEAEELAKIAKERDILFGMTYTYTGFATVRQGREMIDAGMIGDIIHIRADYPEDWVMAKTDGEGGMADADAWRFNTELVGSSLCTNDIATHAEQVITQFTGLHIKRVIAMLDTYPKNLAPLETNSTVLLDFGNNVTGQIWASTIATGHECGMKIYVIGTKGAMEWRNETPDLLFYTPLGEPMRTMVANKAYMCEESRRLSRVAPGHHEGYFETFGNLYRSFMEVLLAKKEGREPESFTFPTVEDGVMGVRFVDACIKSNNNQNVWMPI